MEKAKKKAIKSKLISILISLAIILTLLLLYSRYIGTSGLMVKEYKVKSNDITDNFYGLKIVHISDIHYGRTVNKKELNSLVDKINLLKPDVVVLSGDLIDRSTSLNQKNIDDITNALKKINATLSKYAIMGNHDYKFSKWPIIIENSGFIDLDDNYDLIYKGTNEPILITGVSTNIEIKTAMKTKMKKVNDYLATFTTKESQVMAPKYQILIIHEPDYIDKIDIKNYDLILAGHSHNGQVRLPLMGAIMLPEGAKKYYEPYYKIGNTDLYISSGVGTSVLNFRFMNRPSINLYRLSNK